MSRNRYCPIPLALKGEQGTTFIELGIAAGILMGLSMAGFAIYSHIAANQQANISALGLLGVRTEIAKAIASEDSFKFALQDAASGGVNRTSLDCLVRKKDCREASGAIPTLTGVCASIDLRYF